MDTAQIPGPQVPTIPETPVSPSAPSSEPVVVVQPQHGGSKFFIIAGICVLFGIGASILLFQAYNTTESRTKANLDTSKVNTPDDYVVPAVQKQDSSDGALEQDLQLLDVQLKEVDKNDASLDIVDPEAASDDESKI